jgi:hypothetical protein
MIFSISSGLDKAEKITEGSFASLNIWERTHIEEWVRSNPEILGEDLLVLSTEFDRFVNSSDRLDILALDRDGNLVVVELKRDSAAGYADLQALRYAAMVSSMTIDKLSPYYIAYRKKHYGEQLSDSEARDQIIEFVDSDTFNELSKKPRIILCSEGFSQEITTTVLWLREFQVDIGCVKITPYKIDAKIIIVPSVIIPLQEAKQYLIDIKVKQEEEEQSSRKNRPKTMRILIERGLLKQGDKIFLKNALPQYLKQLQNDQDPRFQAEITGKLGQSDSVRWNHDGGEYSISNLTWKVFKDLHESPRVLRRLLNLRNWSHDEYDQVPQATIFARIA